jgi:hypothetical protein
VIAPADPTMSSGAAPSSTVRTFANHGLSSEVTKFPNRQESLNLNLVSFWQAYY